MSEQTPSSQRHLIPALAALLLTTLACSSPPAHRGAAGEEESAAAPAVPGAPREKSPESIRPHPVPDTVALAAGELIPGAHVAADIGAGQRHLYTVNAAAGTAVAVEVAQDGADVEVELRSPSGGLITTVDSFTGDSKSEHLWWISAEGGEHRIEVRLQEDADTHGRYAISLAAAPRPATQEDRRRVSVARAYARGIELFKGGEYDAAAAAFARSAVGFHRLGETLLEAGARSAEGRAYEEAVRYGAALVPYRRAAELYRRCGLTRDEARRLGNVGEMLRELDRYDEAIEAYQQARKLYAGLDDLDDQSREDLATVLNNLGTLHSILADSEAALSFYERSLDLVPASDPTVLTNMADEYRIYGAQDQAERFYGEAIRAAEDQDDRGQVAWSWSKLCLTFHETGRRAEAEECIRRALTLHRDAENLWGEAASQVILAQIYEAQGDLAAARRNHEGALGVYQRLGDDLSAAIVLSNLGWNDLAADDPAAALTHFQAAVPAIERIGRRHESANALAGLARAHAGLGDLDAALEASQRAIDALEKLRRGPAAPSLRRLTLARRHRPYAFHVELLMRRHERHPGEGWDAAALTASERARARTLLETLALFPSGDPTPEDEATRAERHLVQRLAELEQRRSELLWRGENDAESEVAWLEREIGATELAWWRTRGARAEAGAVDRRLADPLDATTIQRRTVDPGSLMLTYHLGEERSFLWMVSPGHLESRVLPPRRDLEDLAIRAHGLAADSRRRTRRIPARQELDRLSQRLLGPAAERIAEVQRLLFVPDGALFYVPFAALPLPGGDRPLITEHEVVVLPSASTLAALRHRDSRRPPAEGVVAVIADPVFEPGAIPGAAKSGNLPRSDELLRQLPHSRREAEVILELAPAGRRFVATGFDANLDRVRDGALDGYRVVHLATHARVYADRASLILSRFDESGAPRRSELRSQQIFRLNLPAELVTLSACGTALGEEIRGEGLVGLTDAFLNAGASRVLVSLWNVGDRSTAVLMERFYRRLFRDGLSPAAALRTAQLSMWRQEEWRAPYHWAGFILQGEPGKMEIGSPER